MTTSNKPTLQIDEGGLLRRRAVLERRYLDACEDYNVARCWRHPLKTAVAAMEHAEVALADVDRLLARNTQQQKEGAMEDGLFAVTPVTDQAQRNAGVGKELAVAGEQPHGPAQESAQWYSPCPTCQRTVLTIVAVIGGKENVLRLETDKEAPRTYIIDWDGRKNKKRYNAYQSRAYPEHRCRERGEP